MPTGARVSLLAGGLSLLAGEGAEGGVRARSAGKGKTATLHPGARAIA
jgi:hypothetical protein